MNTIKETMKHITKSVKISPKAKSMSGEPWTLWTCFASKVHSSQSAIEQRLAQNGEFYLWFKSSMTMGCGEATQIWKCKMWWPRLNHPRKEFSACTDSSVCRASVCTASVCRASVWRAQIKKTELPSVCRCGLICTMLEIFFCNQFWKISVLQQIVWEMNRICGEKDLESQPWNWGNKFRLLINTLHTRQQINTGILE